MLINENTRGRELSFPRSLLKKSVKEERICGLSLTLLSNWKEYRCVGWWLNLSHHIEIWVSLWYARNKGTDLKKEKQCASLNV